VFVGGVCVILCFWVCVFLYVKFCECGSVCFVCMCVVYAVVCGVGVCCVCVWVCVRLFVCVWLLFV